MAELTDSDKLDIIYKRMKRIELSTHVQTALIIVGFLGIVSLATLVGKLKNNFK